MSPFIAILPLKLLDSEFAMTSEYEHAIRELIRLIVSERDPDALRELASSLELLLKLEGRAARDGGVGSAWNTRAAGS